MGFDTSPVDVNELDEVRAIEEGFKKAYSGDLKGTVEAVDKLKGFALQLIPLDADAENELDIKALVISVVPIRLTSE